MKIDRIIRTKRKSVAMHFTDEGELVVRAPLYMSRRGIEKIVARYEDKLEAVKHKLELRRTLIKKEYAAGEEFFYLGKKYKLVLTDNPAKPIDFNNGFYLGSKYRRFGLELFTALYMDLGYDYISKRAEYYSRLMKLDFKRISITKANKRWGSCSTKGTVNFSWRLIMAPPEIVDYVVVHELAHLSVPNHSAAFWAVVRQFCPDYKKLLAWLKANGPMLNLR